jgi:DNA-binding LacI/PurR family transcriptional regulator
MADLARLARVSSTTVSLSLSGSPKIPAATRERNIALAREAGYQTRLPGNGSLEHERN